MCFIPCIEHIIIYGNVYFQCSLFRNRQDFEKLENEIIVM
jgi:hypothetical protein